MKCVNNKYTVWCVGVFFLLNWVKSQPHNNRCPSSGPGHPYKKENRVNWHVSQIQIHTGQEIGSCLMSSIWSRYLGKNGGKYPWNFFSRLSKTTFGAFFLSSEWVPLKTGINCAGPKDYDDMELSGNTAKAKLIRMLIQDLDSVAKCWLKISSKGHLTTHSW